MKGDVTQKLACTSVLNTVDISFSMANVDLCHVPSGRLRCGGGPRGGGRQRRGWELIFYFPEKAPIERRWGARGGVCHLSFPSVVWKIEINHDVSSW